MQTGDSRDLAFQQSPLHGNVTEKNDRPAYVLLNFFHDYSSSPVSEDGKLS